MGVLSSQEVGIYYTYTPNSIYLYEYAYLFSSPHDKQTGVGSKLTYPDPKHMFWVSVQLCTECSLPLTVYGGAGVESGNQVNNDDWFLYSDSDPQSVSSTKSYSNVHKIHSGIEFQKMINAGLWGFEIIPNISIVYRSNEIFDLDRTNQVSDVQSWNGSVGLKGSVGYWITPNIEPFMLIDIQGVYTSLVDNHVLRLFKNHLAAWGISKGFAVGVNWKIFDQFKILSKVEYQTLLSSGNIIQYWYEDNEVEGKNKGDYTDPFPADYIEKSLHYKVGASYMF